MATSGEKSAGATSAQPRRDEIDSLPSQLRDNELVRKCALKILERLGTERWRDAPDPAPISKTTQLRRWLNGARRQGTPTQEPTLTFTAEQKEQYLKVVEALHQKIDGLINVNKVPESAPGISPRLSRPIEPAQLFVYLNDALVELANYPAAQERLSGLISTVYDELLIQRATALSAEVLSVGAVAGTLAVGAQLVFFIWDLPDSAVVSTELEPFVLGGLGGLGGVLVGGLLGALYHSIEATDWQQVAESAKKIALVVAFFALLAVGGYVSWELHDSSPQIDRILKILQIGTGAGLTVQLANLFLSMRRADKRRNYIKPAALGAIFTGLPAAVVTAVAAHWSTPPSRIIDPPYEALAVPVIALTCVAAYREIMQMVVKAVRRAEQVEAKAHAISRALRLVLAGSASDRQQFVDRLNPKEYWNNDSVGTG